MLKNKKKLHLAFYCQHITTLAEFSREIGGDSCADSFFAAMKKECTCRIEYATLEDVKMAVFECGVSIYLTDKSLKEAFRL